MMRTTAWRTTLRNALSRSETRWPSLQRIRPFGQKLSRDERYFGILAMQSSQVEPAIGGTPSAEVTSIKAVEDVASPEEPSLKEKKKPLKRDTLLGRTKEEMYDLMAMCEVERYRGDQISKYLLHGAKTIDEMEYLPRSFRTKLKELNVRTGRSTIHSTTKCYDGTVKYLLRLYDGRVVEAVAIPHDRHEQNRLTACVSSQVGCALKCTFCATGLGGFGRNLKAAEIIDQVLTIQEEMGRPVTNIVYMGMGEPLLNLNEVVRSVKWLSKTLRISVRGMTISTVGVPRAIRLLAENRLKLTLAVSLHAPDQELREKLVPSAKNLEMFRLFSDCRWYFNRTGRRVTFEYTLLKGINDSEIQAKKLAKKLLRNKCESHVNLLLWNKVHGIDYERPDWETAVKFQEVLTYYTIPTTIRKSRGLEAAAACGQLSNPFQKQPVKDYTILT